MKRQKIILILLSALILMGCSESEIVDERGETTSAISTVETSTTINNENADGVENYNKYSSVLKVETVEMVNGHKNYGITYPNTAIKVIDGEVLLNVNYIVRYTFEGKVIDNENICSIFLYHNGNLHKFNVENSDTYMYTTKVKNGEALNIEISFKITDEIEDYKVVGVSYNDKHNKDEHGEYNQISPPLVEHEFILDLSENNKVYENEEILEICDSYNVEKCQFLETQMVKDILYYKLVPTGCNKEDEFVYRTSDGQYKFGILRMNENQGYMENYTTFIVCDNEIISAFDGKTIMKYKGQGDISLIKEIDLNMSKGEHIVYSVTISDKGGSHRSRFTYFNVE